MKIEGKTIVKKMIDKKEFENQLKYFNEQIKEAKTLPNRTDVVKALNVVNREILALTTDLIENGQLTDFASEKINKLILKIDKIKLNLIAKKLSSYGKI